MYVLGRAFSMKQAERYQITWNGRMTKMNSMTVASKFYKTHYNKMRNESVGFPYSARVMAFGQTVTNMNLINISSNDRESIQKC